jgi:hypothetical protein
MANLTLQVTIPASGVVNLSSALPVPTGGAGNVVGQPPIGNLYVQWLTFQNNAAHAIRYGVTQKVSTAVPPAVSGGTAGFGILLAAGSPGGSGTQAPAINYSTYLSDWWIAGTAGDVIDILALQ